MSLRGPTPPQDHEMKSLQVLLWVFVVFPPDTVHANTNMLIGPQDAHFTKQLTNENRVSSLLNDLLCHLNRLQRLDCVNTVSRLVPGVLSRMQMFQQDAER